MDVDLEQIKKLVKLVEKHHLEELSVEEDGRSVTVKGVNADLPAASVSISPTPGHDFHPETTSVDHETELVHEEIEEPEDDGNYHEITSAMVGVFYRAPSPEEPPYVEVGDTIEIGQAIGLIEAMKVFSEIPAEVAGEVVEISATNGKLVQQGDTLIVVKVKE